MLVLMFETLFLMEIIWKNLVYSTVDFSVFNFASTLSVQRAFTKTKTIGT